MKKLIGLFFSYSGRIGRLQFLLTVVLWTTISISIAMLFRHLNGRNENLFTESLAVIGVILVFWTFFSPWVRRCNDLGWSGLAVLLMFVPLANSILLLCMLFKKGEDKDNVYGSKPPLINLG
jgi:uncharacterized membrane protein YhaH (DUF805 family)